MKLKVPEFLTRRPAFLTRKPARPRPPQKLRAATASRRMAQAMDDDYDEEPTTRLSSAFFVVLILHVVAVGGIYAFNSIKAHRRGLEPAATAALQKPLTDSVPAANPETPPVPAPAAPTKVETPPVLAGTAASSALAPHARSYTVKAGDTLTRIAATTGVSVAELQAANHAKDIAILRPGQVLAVPAKKSADRTTPIEATTASLAAKKVEEPKTTAASTRTYAVKKGDTATSIARRFGVSVDELLKVNKISDPKKLQLGQSLKLPAKK